MRKRTMLYLVGIPGSGKSTFAQANQTADRIWVSHDNILLKHPTWPHIRVYNEMLNICLSTDKDIIYDATNVQIKYRREFLRQVRDSFDFIEAIVFLTPVEKCILRDSKREGVANVGVDVIQRFVNRFTMPTVEEGFDKVTVIHNAE